MKAEPWQLDINAYDFQFSLSPLYSHLDIQRHVNNVAVQSFFTEARVRFHMQALGVQAWFSDTVLLRPRRTVTSFVQETHYLSDVQCAVKLVAMDDRQYRLALALFQHDRCVGVQECLMGAWLDEQWIALPGEVTDRLSAYLAPDVSVSALPELTADAAQLDQYPSKTKIVARFSDLDPDRRLAELSVARYLEQSRTGPLQALPMVGMGSLVVRIDIRYDYWLKGRGKTEVRLPSGVASIGNTSFLLRGGVIINDRLIAASDSVMVVIDPIERRPARIPEELRSALAGLGQD